MTFGISILTFNVIYPICNVDVHVCFAYHEILMKSNKTKRNRSAFKSERNSENSFGY